MTTPDKLVKWLGGNFTQEKSGNHVKLTNLFCFNLKAMENYLVIQF